MKTIITTLLAWAVFMPITFATPAPTEISVGAAMNIAAKQRMLTQRIGKAYLMKAMGENTTQAQRELDASLILFEENQRILSLFAPNKEIKEEVRRVDNFWSIYKNIVSAEPNREDALQVVEGNSQILEACDKSFMLLKNYASSLPNASKDPMVSGTQIAEAISKASTIRLLSQRLALYYTAYKWDIDSDKTKAVLKKCIDDIQFTITELFTSGITSQDADDALGTVVGHWKLLRDGSDKILKLEFTVNDIFETTNSMLYASEKLAAVYEKLI